MPMLTAKSTTTERFSAMCVSAIFFTAPESDSMSIVPGMAAMSAKTRPAIIV
jgi:hypothetical protein